MRVIGAIAVVFCVATVTACTSTHRAPSTEGSLGSTSSVAQKGIECPDDGPSSTDDRGRLTLRAGTLADGRVWQFLVGNPIPEVGRQILVGGTVAGGDRHTAISWAMLIDLGVGRWEADLLGDQYFVAGDLPPEAAAVRVELDDGSAVTSCPVSAGAPYPIRWFVEPLAHPPKSIIVFDRIGRSLTRADSEVNFGLDASDVQQIRSARPGDQAIHMPIYPTPFVNVALPIGGQAVRSPVDLSDPALADGYRLYNQNGCAACHGINGEGGVGPQIGNGATSVVFPDRNDELRWLQVGSNKWGSPTYGATNKPIGVGGQPGYGAQLSNDDLNAIITYEREVLGR